MSSTTHSASVARQAHTPASRNSIDIRFCHTCGFRYKAQWLGSKLLGLLGPAANVTITPVASPLGSFVVTVGGHVAYEKDRSFHGGAPQPTPADVDTLVAQLTGQSLSPEERAEYQAMHRAQIRAGPSPPWSVKLFDPRTGAAVSSDMKFEEWHTQLDGGSAVSSSSSSSSTAATYTATSWAARNRGE